MWFGRRERGQLEWMRRQLIDCCNTLTRLRADVDAIRRKVAQLQGWSDDNLKTHVIDEDSKKTRRL